jgi:uncharacterized protein YhbP (UPF0306 family)
MANDAERKLIEDVLRRNRYLVLATTDGDTPWVAPLEYMVDDALNLYFLSTDDSRHVRDVVHQEVVAVAVFDRDQPEYGPQLTTALNGVQLEGVASRVAPPDYSDAILAAIEALSPPMPPYSVFKIEPRRFFLPRIENGVNVRSEVE